MKKIVISSVLSAQLVLSAGIPVIDGAANAQMAIHNVQTITTWVKEAKRWADTIIHFKSQLKAYEKELLSQTGIKRELQFFKDLKNLREFAKKMGKDFLSLDSDILTGTGGKFNQLFNKYSLFDNCNYDGWDTTQRNHCKSGMVRRVKELNAYQGYNEKLTEFSKNLTKLSHAINNSKDIKTTSDIGNQIQAQIAQINLAKSQIELLNEQNKRYDEITKKREEQIFIKNMKRPIKDYEFQNFFKSKK